MALHSAFMCWLIFNEWFILTILRKLSTCGNSRRDRSKSVKKQVCIFDR